MNAFLNSSLISCPGIISPNGRLPATFWPASAGQNVAEAERKPARSEAGAYQDFKANRGQGVSCFYFGSMKTYVRALEFFFA